MKIPLKYRLTLALVLIGLGAGPVMAQKDDKPVLPDPSHIPFTLPKNIPWKETGPGEYQAKLFGDEKKPGIYGVLIKWMPGHFSRPHSHSQQRYIYVVSGTWWVSSSSTYDPSKTYPLPAGTFAMDNINAIHWDGAKSETGPAILELVGIGPVVTTRVKQ